jgi:hypothetical protein
VKTEISPVGGLSTSENNFGKAKENLMALLHCLLAVTSSLIKQGSGNNAKNCDLQFQLMRRTVF